MPNRQFTVGELNVARNPRVIAEQHDSEEHIFIRRASAQHFLTRYSVQIECEGNSQLCTEVSFHCWDVLLLSRVLRTGAKDITVDGRACARLAGAIFLPEIVGTRCRSRVASPV